MEATPEELVAQLIIAENTRDKRLAKSIVSTDFVITRSRGVEQGAKELLDELANPANEHLIRELDPSSVHVERSSELAVAWSVVHVHSAVDEDAPRRHFRNLHVFRHAADGFRCRYWQVTELADMPTPPGSVTLNDRQDAGALKGLVWHSRTGVCC